MASTSITTVGGVVVVTQVIPKDESSIPLEGTPTAGQAPPPVARAPPPDPVKMDEMTAAFMRGHPMPLGVVQIFIGVMIFLFSLTILLWWTLFIHLPFGLAFIFIISGSLAVAAGRRTSVSLVWASLVSHLVSVVVAMAGVIYDCILIGTQAPTTIICRHEDLDQFTNPESVWIRCVDQMWTLTTTLYGLLGFVLVLLVLQVCISVTVCVFSVRAANLRHTYKPVQSTSDERPLLASP